ncbi:NAD(P)-binding domain-containing protein [Paracrocinitomix mangrovi]|uniref:NAD(P)-dependent oxidoreductase n=1 Tax=Paracrocinitomix mangrovi TaxID=2862509 RepID=UPI001C8E8493|nr:NAD(P)-dependent oxidoreductase [Paracrocinitomix mangrovi]UKN02766.1 NAD(P)-binding domain-containing protein [Paracrocinitomix mangrovi]
MKILANDGIAPEGVKALENAGFEVSTTNVPQEQLADAINNEGYVGVLVRSATTVRQEVIDACPNLKLIGRGGVGMDNIDVDYARSKGLYVINTPAASSQSVAELVMGCLFSLSRSVFHSNRFMPEKGAEEFKALKKLYGKGQELRGKTIGIIGFGRIGQSLASYALGVGMKVKAVDLYTDPVKIPVLIEGHGRVDVPIEPVKDLNEIIGELDYISLHVPKQADGSAVIGTAEFAKMKDGVILANAARGGVIDEDALLQALDSGKVRAVSLDVFENEPTPRKDLLTNEKIAATPHIGAATNEAQTRIGLELAEQIISLLKN